MTVLGALFRRETPAKRTLFGPEILGIFHCFRVAFSDCQGLPLSDLGGNHVAASRPLGGTGIGFAG
jgi:hypothetical protein